VPRYFFNLCSDEYEETDLIGKACPDDLAALGEALAKASSILQQRLLAERFCNSGSIEVEDEESRCVLRLPLRAAAY
jgi:hypothetical protein